MTIQQVSLKSHDLSAYQPHADRLSELIHQHAPGAKLLVHQTWAYRKDDPHFTKPSDKPGEPITQAKMYAGLSAAYAAITKELGARRIPVGDAFYLADTNPQWGYQTDTAFDYKAVKQPALPLQKHSLHVGWQWKKQTNGKTTFGMDGHHANAAGEYIGACVWYEWPFAQSPVGNAYVPTGLDAAYARFLQDTARRAVIQEQVTATSGMIR